MKRIGIFLLALSFLVSVFSGCSMFSLDTMGGTFWRYEDSEKYHVGGASISDEIRNIDVHWINGSVKLAYHDGEDFVFSETSSDELSEAISLHYLVEGDTLTLQYAKSGVTLDVVLSKDLTILIPRNRANGDMTLLRSLDVETVNAAVLVESLAVSSCEFENISGRVEADFSDALSDLKLETVSGNADIAVLAADEVEIETVSGDVMLTVGNADFDGAVRNLEAHCVSGDLTLMLPETAAFSLSMETVSGMLDCGFEATVHGKTYVVGRGGGEFTVETVSGDIKIQKIH